MDKFIRDLKGCFKISLKVFGISVLIGLIIGLIGALIHGNFAAKYILKWGGRISLYAGCFGLFMCAISFTKKDLMRPLNYEKQWKTYFLKFNLSHVIFFVSAFCTVYSIVLDTIVFYI